MAYSKRFNERSYDCVRKIIEEMQNLSIGDSLTVPDLSGDEVLRVRWLLYDWLSHQGLKPAFRIRTKGSSVEVERIRATFEEVEVERVALSPKAEEILKDFIYFKNNEKEVKELLEERKDITKEESERVLEEWKRIMS